VDRPVSAGVSASSTPAGIRAIVLDIEGTTTPIAFVFDVLFPYVRRHVRAHLEQHANDPEYRGLFDRLRAEHAADESAGGKPPPWTDAPDDRLTSVVSYVEWLMDRDRKSTGLKDLQGRIWEDGYNRGDLASDVFPDVPGALVRWHARGVRVAIFSSGSVRAQQLLFRHSSFGDLTRFISHFFDTTTGPKADPESYRRIAHVMDVAPGAIVFVSDVTRELEAARGAGMQTRLAVRPGNPAPGSDHAHPALPSFDELL
jgi:enolase-phosphatase E1